MRRSLLPPLLLALLAAALVATIVLELRGRSRDSEAMLPSAVPSLPTPTGRSAAPAPGQIARWAATSLARPLFSPGRRPPAVEAAAPGAAPPSLPRVAGVVVTPAGRQAIFAAKESDKPLVVGEGGRVGAFTVQSIRAGQVTVRGPGGERVLQPAFDPDAPAPAAPQPVAPPAAALGAPGMAGTIPGLPGFHLQPPPPNVANLPGFGPPRGVQQRGNR
jgi:general secretion pathway protein N